MQQKPLLSLWCFLVDFNGTKSYCVSSPEVMLLGRKLPIKYPSFERTIWGLDFFFFFEGGWCCC